MDYLVRFGETIAGPWPLHQLVRHPGVYPDTLVCRADRPGAWEPIGAVVEFGGPEDWILQSREDLKLGHEQAKEEQARLGRAVEEVEGVSRVLEERVQAAEGRWRDELSGLQDRLEKGVLDLAAERAARQRAEEREAAASARAAELAKETERLKALLLQQESRLEMLEARLRDAQAALRQSSADAARAAAQGQPAQPPRQGPAPAEPAVTWPRAGPAPAEPAAASFLGPGPDATPWLGSKPKFQE